MKHLRKHALAIAVFAAVAVSFAIPLYRWSTVPPAQETATTTPSRAQEFPEIATTTDPELYAYVEIIDSCGPYYQGTCVNLRSGPGTSYPVVMRLRNSIVLKVASEVTTTSGETWYRIDPGADVRYPERITTDWYVIASAVDPVYDPGDEVLEKGDTASTTKRIVIDLTKEMLYAYDGGTLFMQQAISTGLNLTPTPRGVFTVYKKTPSRYMQGPLPGISDQYYDLPGVPWDLYFTPDGAAIHGAYWHDHFGHPWSHGCVNLPPDKAHELYEWADLGTSVVVTN